MKKKGKSNCRICTLNANSLNFPWKRTAIKSFCNDFEIGVLMVQETHALKDKRWAKDLGFTKSIWSDGRRNSAGVAILAKGNIEVITSNTDKNGRIATMKVKIDNEEIILANNYAPNLSQSLVDRRNYVDHLTSLEGFITTMDMGTPIILGGDFNITHQSEDGENKNRRPPLECKQSLDMLLENLGLKDSKKVGKNEGYYYTYTNRTNANFYGSRLDYIFLSEDISERCVDFLTIETGVTDHRAVIIEIKGEREIGPGLWKLNNLLLEDSKLIDIMRTNIGEIIHSNTSKNTEKQIVWEMLKQRCRTTARRFSSEAADHTKAAKENISTCLEVALNQKNLHEVKKLKEQLMQFEREKAIKTMFRANCEYIEHDEKCTRYFFRRIKSNFLTSNIGKLDTPNGTIISRKEIAAELDAFYKDLYSTKMHNTGDWFNDTSRKIEVDKRASTYDTPFNTNEYFRALRQMSNNKAPGDDGLSVKFYKTFWNDLKQSFTECMNENLRKQEMTSSQKRSIIKLIEKKNKDRALIKNWRPISLINVDSKILSKAIANRLCLYLDRLIGGEQKAFVKGRLMNDNVANILTATDYMLKHNIKGGMLSVDFQKAFDSVEHASVWKALKAKGFSNFLIDATRTLYAKANSKVINFGFTGSEIKIERSCRQGDCVSPYLFIIVLEFLLERLRNRLQGIEIREEEKICVFAFADDLVCIVRNKEELIKVKDILNSFGQATGLKINAAKSYLLNLGITQSEVLEGFSVKNEITVTGTTITNNRSQTGLQGDIWNKIKCSRDLPQQWQHRKISILGRGLLVNSILYGRLNLPMAFAKMEKKEESVLKRTVRECIWKKRARFKPEITEIPRDLGGIGVANPMKRNNYILLQWLRRYDNSKEIWAKQLKYDLEKLGGFKALNVIAMKSRYWNEMSTFNRNILSAMMDLNEWRLHEETIWGNENYIINGFLDSRLAKKGYIRVIDFVDDDGRIKEAREATNSYNLNLAESMEWAMVIKKLKAKFLVLDTRETNLLDDSIRINNTVIPLAECTLKKLHSTREWSKFEHCSKLESELQCEISNYVGVKKIWELTNVTRIRSFFCLFSRAVNYSNKMYAVFGCIDSSKCTWCTEPVQSRTHLFYDCETTRLLWRKVLDCNCIRATISQWLKGELSYGKGLIVGYLIFFTHAQNYKRVKNSEEHFYDWLHKIMLTEGSIAQKNYRDLTHLQKWEAVEFELQKP